MIKLKLEPTTPFFGIAEREADIPCLECPYFNPDEAPCHHRLSGEPCPRKEEPPQNERRP
jgi:hypothetical protein